MFTPQKLANIRSVGFFFFFLRESQLLNIYEHTTAYLTYTEMQGNNVFTAPCRVPGTQQVLRAANSQYNSHVRMRKLRLRAVSPFPGAQN